MCICLYVYCVESSQVYVLCFDTIKSKHKNPNVVNKDLKQFSILTLGCQNVKTD